MRVSPIHVMVASIPPIGEAFRRPWPEAAVMNLPDDSFTPASASMPAGLDMVAPHAVVWLCRAPGALYFGDGAGRDAGTSRAAAALARRDVIALAQLSLFRAAGPVAAATGRTVLATPDGAVSKSRYPLLPTTAA
jgi:hypothetical protein